MLKRKLTTFDLTMIAIGSTIGSGIFLTPARIAGELPAAGWMLLVWAVGGVVAFCGALTFAELAQRFPDAGGVYAFLKRAYGPVMAYLYGWATLTVITTGAIAALSLGFADYAAIVLEEVGMEVGDVGKKGIAIGGIAVVTVINLAGAKAGGMFSNIFTVLKLLGIAFLVVAGFFMVSESQLDFGEAMPEKMDKSLWTAFAAALVGVFWSYGGWHHASFVSGEAINPRKSVPRAMVIGTLVITTTYLLVNLAYLRMLPVGDIVGNEGVAATAMKAVMGVGGGLLIAIAISISTYGTAGIYTLTAPRIYHQMAEDRTFFPFLARIHPRFGTPANAILLQSAWAVVLIFAWGTFSNLIGYVVFTDWIFLTAAAISIFLLPAPQIKDQAPLPKRSPIFFAAPLIFILISSWFIIKTLVGEPVHALAGLTLLAAGLLVYWGWKQWGNPGQKI
ncbi:MAG: amino acid permease [Bacteroidota bacterium]